MAGIASGWLLSSSKAKGNSVTQTSDKQESQIEQEIQEGDIEGLDEAEGTLIEGGIEGEGTNHLEKEHRLEYKSVLHVILRVSKKLLKMGGSM